jgi:hypothetical protein
MYDGWNLLLSQMSAVWTSILCSHYLKQHAWTRNMQVSHLWDWIEKEFSTLIQMPIFNSNFKSFLVSTFALWARIWCQKGSVPYTCTYHARTHACTHTHSYYRRFLYTFKRLLQKAEKCTEVKLLLVVSETSTVHYWSMWTQMVDPWMS